MVALSSPLPLPIDPDLTALAAAVVETYEAAPCAVVAAASASPFALTQGAGAFGHLWPGGPQARTTSLFDLASLTKPVTALVAARLARAGVVSLATPLGDLVPETRSTPTARLSLDLLLAHRAGLDPHAPLFAPLVHKAVIDKASAFVAAASSRRSECHGEPPAGGFAPLYSDLGYLLVGEALARVAGEPLAALVEREINAPLRTKLCVAEALASRLDELAPTEHAPLRGGHVHGHVHDENAWALCGKGTCGHAGLFGSAYDVLALGVAVVRASLGQLDTWLTRDQIEPLLRVRPGGALRAGFDGKSGPASSAGARFGPSTFGHLGFTGTSVWIDPNASLVGVLLTNRVYLGRDVSAPRIRSARPYVYDGLYAWSERLTTRG